MSHAILAFGFLEKTAEKRNLKVGSVNLFIGGDDNRNQCKRKLIS